MQTPSLPPKIKALLQPLDRAALGLMVILAVLIGMLLLNGDRSAPRVRDFSWNTKQVGADDNAFVLSFNRPMDHASVEQNLRIDPPLPGKPSWAGRRMAYTLNSPAPYGTNYQISLQNAKDRFAAQSNNAPAFQSFTGTFRSRDRMFAYIASEGADAGRLVLYNLTRQDKKILTPPNLVVLDFEPYADSDRILFSAVDRANQQSLVEQKLYTVTTGIQVDQPKAIDQLQELSWLNDAPPPSPSGQVTEILDNKLYQNLKFDLSLDGQTIVVQRISRRDPNDSGPWVIRGNAPAESMNNKQPGGDFLITPDGSSLAIAQGQGLAILPLKQNADPLNFLTQFGKVLSFSRDGMFSAMVKFNNDYTRSLFLVSAQGAQQEIFKTTGSIVTAQFSPNKQVLYCLLTNLLPGDAHQEQPYIAAVDLKEAREGKGDKSIHPLVVLPNQRDVQVSMALDGSALLFDQTQPDPTGQAVAIADSRLWLLPLTNDFNTKIQPEAIPLPGYQPRWLP